MVTKKAQNPGDYPEANLPQMEPLPQEEAGAAPGPYNRPVTIFWTHRGPLGVSIKVMDDTTRTEIEERKVKDPLESLDVLQALQNKYPQVQTVKTPWFEGPIAIILKKLQYFFGKQASQRLMLKKMAGLASQLDQEGQVKAADHLDAAMRMLLKSQQ